MTLPPSTIRHRKPTRRQRALMAMGIPVTLKKIQEPIEKPKRRPKHPRKLTRRQRMLQPGRVTEFYNLAHPEKIKQRPARIQKPRSERNREKEIAERNTGLAHILKVPFEVWQQQIEEDLKKLEEEKQLEKLRRRELAAQERKAKRRDRPKRYYQEFYGPSWFPVQAEAMARSGGICELCKISNATHVHHILPIRYFADSEDAHYINNTLAVCVPCHKKEHRQLGYKFPLFNHLKLNLCRSGRVTPTLFRLF